MKRVGTLLRSLFWTSVCLALVIPGVALADQRDQRLDELFAVLQATNNYEEAARAEKQIWEIWMDGNREDVNRLMSRGIRAMARSAFPEAIEVFGQILELAPGFAEGWNKRATVYYLADDLEASVRDIEHTLALEPRHFGAISGMGLIFLQRRDEAGALRAFEEVLKINPHARGARMRVEELRRKLGGEEA